MYIRFSSIYSLIFFHLLFHLSIKLSMQPFNRPCVRPHVRPFVCPYICTCVCLSVFLFNQIVTCLIISCTYGIFFYWIVTLMRSLHLGFFFIRLFHQYFLHLEDYILLNRYVNTSRTNGILLHSIVKLVSRAFFGFSFLLVCYVSISCTFRIPFHPIVMLVSHALLDSLPSDCQISISCTIRMLFHCIAT